jgi:hypothetical protein
MYAGAILVTMLNADLVDDILPSGLFLVKRTDPTIRTHPVIVMLGVQGDLGPLRGGVPVALGVQCPERFKQLEGIPKLGCALQRSRCGDT